MTSSSTIRSRAITAVATRLCSVLAVLGAAVLGATGAPVYPTALRISRTFAPHLTLSPGGQFSGSAAAPAAHGGFYVTGSFTAIDGAARYGVARFQADGSPDTGFSPPADLLYVRTEGSVAVSVQALAVQSDGKVLVAYTRKLTAGRPSESVLVRLHANGAIDPSLPAVLIGGYVTDLDVQGDGKMLVAGGFQSVNGASRSGIVRIAFDGTVDGTFNPPTFTGPIWRLAIAPDGSIVVAELNGSSGASSFRVTRLLANGSADPLFSLSSITITAAGLDLAVQGDGKLIVMGPFSQVGGTAAGSIARFHADGIRDTTFNVGAGLVTPSSAPADAASPVLQPDGKIVVLTNARTFNGTAVGEVVRLNPDGSLDGSFISDLPGYFLSSGYIEGLARLANGSFAAATFDRAWKLDATGTVDYGFNPKSEAPMPPPALVVAGSNQWLVGFSFGPSVGGGEVLVRLTADGAKDPNFRPVLPSGTWAVSAIEPVANGQTLIATGVYVGGIRYYYKSDLMRVNPDGSRAPAFVTADLPPYLANVSVDGGGRLVLWGGALDVELYPGASHITALSLQRLNANGARDSSFSPGDTITSRSVLALVHQSTGRIVISLAATDTQDSRFLRLTQGGSSDGSFTTGTGFDGEVRALAIQPDDKIIVAGPFTLYRGVAVPGLARINANGSHDPSFQVGAGFDRVPTKIVVQGDGKIVFAGDFTTYQGTPVTGWARLLANGTLDTTLTINGSMTTIAAVTAWTQDVAGNILMIATNTLRPEIDANSAGVILLEPAAPPQIATQPVSTSVTAGGAVIMSVTATGVDPLSYQWRRNGANISGATTATYTLPSVQAFHAGQYSVVVSAAGFSVTSNAAVLSVVAAPPSASRLANLSTRAVCLTGDGVLVPGFVVSGTGSKRLLLRAVGPTLGLSPFGLSGVLPDPRMTLKRRNAASGFLKTSPVTTIGAPTPTWPTLSRPARG